MPILRARGGGGLVNEVCTFLQFLFLFMWRKLLIDRKRGGITHPRITCMPHPPTSPPEKSADFFIDSIRQSFLKYRAKKFDSNSCKHDACQLLNWYRFDYFRPRPTWWTRSKVILHIWIWIFWVKWSTFDKNRASNELHQFDQRFFCTMKRESCMKFRFCNTTPTMQGKYKWTNRNTGATNTNMQHALYASSRGGERTMDLIYVCTVFRHVLPNHSYR